MRAIDADAFDERVRVAGGMSEEELTEDFKDGVRREISSTMVLSRGCPCPNLTRGTG